MNEEPVSAKERGMRQTLNTSCPAALPSRRPGSIDQRSTAGSPSPPPTSPRRRELVQRHILSQSPHDAFW